MTVVTACLASTTVCAQTDLVATPPSNLVIGNYNSTSVGPSDDGVLRFRGRPESNVTDYYVDSDSIEADHGEQLALESAWGNGPFLVTAEYTHAWVDAPASDHPRFWGTYVALSYVLTGEHRPYDKKVAYARRILPEHR